MISVVRKVKDFLIIVPLTLALKPFSKLFSFIYFFNRLLIFIRVNKSKVEFCDKLSLTRDYSRRYALYKFILEKYELKEAPITYLEFGVSGGYSFKWWVEENKNKNSDFIGFDTFEGLPEKWGAFSKGAMAANIPVYDDTRVSFEKGLFQETLCPFIEKNKAILLSDNVRVIHMDADLYSATIFTLSQLYPYLKRGDIIMFDEFNVPLHEFRAFDEFTSAFYIKLKPIAAINNFYQTAFVLE